MLAVPGDGPDFANLTNTPDVVARRNIAFNSKPKQAPVHGVALMDTNRIWTVVAWSADDRTLYANRVEVSFTDADDNSIDT